MKYAANISQKTSLIEVFSFENRNRKDYQNLERWATWGPKYRAPNMGLDPEKAECIADPQQYSRLVLVYILKGKQDS